MAELMTNALEKLLQDFYNLANIKTCLYDIEGNELCFYPKKFSDFCEILRQNQLMDKKCKDCDKLAFEHCKRTQSQYIYTCHAGLEECISPIICDNRVIGFIMIGQIKSSNAPSFNDIATNLPGYLLDDLKDTYERLPTISSEKLNSAFRILDACAGYELLKKAVGSDNNSIDAQIQHYIRENISRPLSVAHLRSVFHLSHSEIYNIFKEYFDCTPADYIKKSRLKYACKLLATTDLPINRVAVLSGIPDYNYFSKIFKSTYNISPSEYRKKSEQRLDI